MPTSTIRLDPGNRHHQRTADGELSPKPSPMPAPIAGQPAEPPAAEPDPQDQPPPALPTVTVTLQDRHYAWAKDAAAREGRSLDNFIGGLVRQAYVADPMRIRNTLPQMPGQPAGTARR